MHWDTFTQDNYSAVGGDEGLARYKPALLPPMPDWSSFIIADATITVIGKKTQLTFV